MSVEINCSETSAMEGSDLFCGFLHCAKARGCNPRRGDEFPPLFCVFQQYSRSFVFVPTLCVPGATVQSCHVSFCASTAVWERSLQSTSCFLVVVQRILFVPSRLA